MRFRSIPGRRVEGVKPWHLKEGDFYFCKRTLPDDTVVDVIWMYPPCDGEESPYSSVELNTERGWVWNGNEDKPTLSPSIESQYWHGYLEDGFFRAHD